jgi:ubiquinone/menaquinone biosynthesis C-methylase UbiE
MNAEIDAGNGTAPMETVEDEAALLESLVPLGGATVLELGCGNAEFSRRLVQRTVVASVTALEVDEVQHRLNLEAPRHPRLTLRLGAAESIPFPQGEFDVVLMMKSLHHVPPRAMDAALAEIRRVLKPGGWLYVSEPVYAGALNEIIRLFHDEGSVRAAAYEALKRAGERGVLEWVAERPFQVPVHYRNYEEFVAKHVQLTHSRIDYPESVAAEVRRRLNRAMTPAGASFMRPMRINLLRRTR